MRFLVIVIFIAPFFTIGLRTNDVNNQLKKESITYKKIGDTFLKLHLFHSDENNRKPVIVFFHPGGWISGSPTFFFDMAKQYSRLGYTSICVQYRLINLTSITPTDCLEDSKDALRYLNTNSETLNLDMSNLFLIGYSAGGHLALMTQLNEDKTIPTAKKIFTIASPVDLTKDELLKQSTMTTKDKVQISPTNKIQYLTTQLYTFNGTKDELVKYSTIFNFRQKAEKINKKIEAITFKDAGHFLLNTKLKQDIEQRIKQEILKE